MKNIIVIGAGPAGMMAAGTAAQRGYKVTLLEKNDRIGKKLYITGKGRCNVTNATDPEEMLTNIPGNPYFMYSALYTLDSAALMAFFEELGVALKVERGNRVFPVSDKSADITDAMRRFLKKTGVSLKLSTKVLRLKAENDSVTGVVTDKGFFPCDSLIIATGGLSYPLTGSTGDGYRFAQKLGHTVTKLYPSLVPLKVRQKGLDELAGLSLKNITAECRQGGKSLYKGFGELLFTHTGISGPLVLTMSRHITATDKNDTKVYIDLKPALTDKQLDERILRDFTEVKNKALKNSLSKLLPKAIIPVVIEKAKISPDKQVNSVTKEERAALCRAVKSFELEVIDTEGFEQAVVTKGGVSVNEIDPSTMRSKLISNLYFAGEVIDVDAYTGGFNLQIAFSTGYLAGISV